MKRARRSPAGPAREPVPQPVPFIPARWPQRRRRMALSALLLAALLLVLARWDSGLTTIGDDAQYVVLAQSILQGKGMRHVNDPMERIHDKYPPLYPMVLAPFAALNDRLAKAGDASVLKIPTVVSSLIAVWCAFLLVERRLGTGGALLAGALTAGNFYYLEFSQMVMAEIPYAAFTMGALLVLDRWAAAETQSENPPGSVLRSPLAWTSLLLLTAAYYTRTAGLALVAGTIVFFFLRRRRPAATFTLIGFALAALPWFLRNRLAGAPGTYLKQLFLKDPYRPEDGPAGVADFALRVMDNMRIYGLGSVPQLLFPHPAAVWGQNPWAWLFVVLVTLGLLGIGFVPRLRGGFTPTEMYVGATFGMCLLWPTVWSSERFILPILPLLLFYFLDGGRRALTWAGRRGAVFTARATVWSMAAILLVVDGQGAWASIRSQRALTPDWESYYQAADWVRENTPADSVIICRKPYLFYFRTHRKTLGYVFSTDPTEVLASVADNGATHIVIDCFRWTNTTYRYLVPAVQSRREAFEVVYRTGPVFADQPDRTFVLEVVDPGAMVGDKP